MERAEIIVKCCKCHRVRTDGRWEYEEGKDPAHRRYSHSYCPGCLIKVHADLEVVQLFSGP
ncbi:MAG: hypothetical protein V1873_01830 [Verrucomicrobiota bacterium]